MKSDLESIKIGHLLPELDKLLFELLNELSEEQWHLPTIAGAWKVKDIAAHLLDGNMRAIAMIGHGYLGEKPVNISTYGDLVAFLNGLNHMWVEACKRLSPAQIVSLLRQSGEEYCQLMASLDPNKDALFAVAWAGEEVSKNWFHIAREYTEKWHHQQQIRLAIDQQEVLLQQRYYWPFLETSMRALPHQYRATMGDMGQTISIQILGGEDRVWFLKYENGWNLSKKATSNKRDCSIEILPEVAWRIFTKGISADKAKQQSSITGNKILAEPFFKTLAIMG